PRLLGVLDHADAVDEGVARGRLVEGGEDAHGRRLAGAVGADEAEDLPGGEAERDVIDRLGPPIVFLEVVDANAHRRGPPSGCRRPARGPDGAEHSAAPAPAAARRRAPPGTSRAAGPPPGGPPASCPAPPSRRRRPPAGPLPCPRPAGRTLSGRPPCRRGRS